MVSSEDAILPDWALYLSEIAKDYAASKVSNNAELEKPFKTFVYSSTVPQISSESKEQPEEQAEEQPQEESKDQPQEQTEEEVAVQVEDQPEEEVVELQAQAEEEPKAQQEEVKQEVKLATTEKKKRRQITGNDIKALNERIEENSERITDLLRTKKYTKFSTDFIIEIKKIIGEITMTTMKNKLSSLYLGRTPFKAGDLEDINTLIASNQPIHYFRLGEYTVDIQTDNQQHIDEAESEIDALLNSQ